MKSPPLLIKLASTASLMVLVLAFMVELLRGYRWELPPQDLTLDRRRIPPEPRDGLRIKLRARS
jgi:hypothetical protein